MEKVQKKINLSRSEIEELSRRLQSKSLCDKDYAILIGMLGILVTLNDLIRQKSTSINRLLKRIFGIKTEKRKKLFDNEIDPEKQPPPSTGNNDDGGGDKNQKKGEPPLDEAPSSSEKKTDNNSGNTQEIQITNPQNGHGRNGIEAFPGAEHKSVKHANLKAGQNCPFQCPNGRLYPLKPGFTLCFEGSAPIDATIFEREKLRCSACGAVFTAEIENASITGIRHYDASANAAIPIYKYGFGMPFYRISKFQEMVGIPLPSSTLWDKTEALANTVLPVYQEMVRQAAQARIFHNDDTTMPVLSFIKENKQKTDKERTGMFTTGIVAILDDNTTIALFFTGRNHAGENLDALQKLRNPEKATPIQMCDALSRNTNESFVRYVSHCLVHGRRNFVDILPVFPDECQIVIDTLAKVYKNDDISKKKAMSDQERLAYHKEHSGPAMKTLHDWMKQQIEGKLVEPNSILGKAISYMLKYWPALTLFLSIAGAPLDNNICERILKQIVLNRKNAMFYKTQVGAWIGDIFTSIIHTCYLGKINPMNYLIKLQRYETQMKKKPEKWMPWNYQETVAQIESKLITL